MIVSSKEQFFKECAPTSEDVKVKDGLSVRITEMSATEFINLWVNPDFRAEGNNDAIDLRKITPALIVGSATDEDGIRIFSDEDAANLEKKVGSAVFIKLGTVARRINGISGAEEKNSEASPEECSSTGSLSS